MKREEFSRRISPMAYTPDKLILDATCGGRMMWFDSKNPHAHFCDKRKVPQILVGKGKNARTFECNPDTIADFKNLPFPDDTFYLVVFDPPHLLRAGKEKSYMAVKYGTLPADWKTEIHDGFHECMRVLKPFGTLVFKWSEVQLPTSKIKEAIGVEPLFGHISGKRNNTHWMTFMKIPKEAKDEDSHGQ